MVESRSLNGTLGVRSVHFYRSDMAIDVEPRDLNRPFCHTYDIVVYST